jgi:hypothetical protein
MSKAKSAAATWSPDVDEPAVGDEVEIVVASAAKEAAASKASSARTRPAPKPADLPNAATSKAGRPMNLTIRPFPADEYRAIRERALANASVAAEPAEQAPAPPQGMFAMLSGHSRCSNLDCSRPVLVAGKYCFAHTAGKDNGKVLCVGCACEAHPALRAHWQSKRSALAARCGEREVARVEAGDVDNRARRPALSRWA